MTAIAILRNEHAVIIEALDLLEHHARRVQAGASLDQDFARWILQFIREFAEDFHLAKEDGFLFELLENRGFSRESGDLAATLADREAARQQARDMERALGALDSAGFAAAGLALASQLRRRLLRENDSLFRRAEELLTAEQNAAVLQNFGKVVHEREGVLMRQRHLAAIERWRKAFGTCLPPGV